MKSRRDFVKNSFVLATGVPLVSSLEKLSFTTNTPPPEPVFLRWLEEAPPVWADGVTWGVPWPRGTMKKGTEFSLADGDSSAAVPVQSRPLAYWPDGSLKWTAHSIGAQPAPGRELRLQPGAGVVSKQQLKLRETATEITVDTGLLQCALAKKGNVLVHSLARNGKKTAENGTLVLLVQDGPSAESKALKEEQFAGSISAAVIEQQGPLAAVVKMEGTHQEPGGRTLLPFVVRLYFYVGSDSVKMMHTIVYDADEQKDFLKGIGLRFQVPLEGELHNRHVRFSGAEKGVFAEAVRGLTGLRRDPGKEIRTAQVSGKETPPVGEFPDAVASRLSYIPAFGDYTLFQSSPDSFQIQKRTKPGHGWLQSAFGTRSSGMVYLGTPQGGLAMGVRNFWQSFPAQIDVRNAHTPKAELTVWLWAPRSEAMDLRFYHDGMGQDSFEKQREGLEITYEDYEPGFGRPLGVARTSELQFRVLAETPSNERFSQMAHLMQHPPLLTCQPDYWKKAGVFGFSWDTVSTPSTASQKIEKQLDWYFTYYQQQIDAHRWYGFWNFGDVMHSYEADRHTWKYDIGGFAWDNSELSTDLWLWYYFLHTGRSDVFRMAEAMTRHTGEVDVHHIGPFSPLGSRHNVYHWGCSAKQLRISTVANRRFYYYLTADERVGDLMREQLEAARTLQKIVPGRKVGQNALSSSDTGFAGVSFGTDWGSLAAAWFTEWERTGNVVMKERLLNSMRTIAQQPKGFFTGASEMELSTGKFRLKKTDNISVSHLNAVFGLPEICYEITDVVNMPEFDRAWLQYCTLYNASPGEQRKELGRELPKLNLRQAHARLTAFAGRKKNDPALIQRAWDEFYEGGAGIRNPSLATQSVAPPAVLNALEEAREVSTNAVAQWGLTALALLHFGGGNQPAL